MNEINRKERTKNDARTISVAHSLGAAIEYACGGRYDVAIFHTKGAMKELERLRDVNEQK